jgi:hypothetical protein
LDICNGLDVELWKGLSAAALKASSMRRNFGQTAAPK